MFRLLFFLLIYGLLGPNHIYAEPEVSPTTSLTSNVKIDLNPTGNKTVIPEKPVDDANIFLNFENASLESVLNYLAEEKKINVLPHAGLGEQKVSLSTRQPLTLERAWNILLTIMEMTGYTINQVGDLHRVVSNKEKGAQDPLPYYNSKTTPPENLPDTSLMIRYIYFLTNLKKEAAQGILGQMLEGAEGVLQYNEELQACIIKEKSINIKAAMKVIKELDAGGLRESIKIITLQEASADIIAKQLEDIIGTADKDKNVRFSASSKKKETTYFSSSTRIVAYPAKNQLILLGNDKNINRVVDFIFTYLDKPLGSASSRLHIKEVRYAKAQDIATILEKILKPPSGQGNEKSSVVGRYKFFEDVKIKAEEASAESRGAGNRLIIACNEEDWERLDQFIDSIDKPQPQVAMEVMLVNLTESQSKSLGVQMQNKAGSNIGMGLNRMEFNNLSARGDIKDNSANAVENPIQNLITTGAKNLSNASPVMMTLGKINVADSTNNVWALIKSNFNITSGQVIGQPYLIANNHEKDCKIEVKDTRRLQGPLSSRGGEPQKATFEPVEAGTVVTLEPNINSDGIVDLNIKINLDQFVDATSADAQPTKIKRNIDTKSTMMSGEVLVLGGFKTSQQTVTEYKTPLLADIPIIGNFFRSKSKTKDENYLFMFIRSSIIKPQFEGGPDEYTQLKLDYAKYHVIKNDAYAKERDPIQRWFFKPSNYSVKEKLDEARLGIFAPIDDFAQNKQQPKSVEIKDDPHFKVSEAVSKRRKGLKSRSGTELLAKEEPSSSTASTTSTKAFGGLTKIAEGANSPLITAKQKTSDPLVGALAATGPKQAKVTTADIMGSLAARG